VLVDHRIDVKIQACLELIDLSLPVPPRPFWRHVSPLVSAWVRLTIPELKKLATEKGLRLSGNKKELLQRLNQHELHQAVAPAGVSS